MLQGVLVVHLPEQAAQAMHIQGQAICAALMNVKINSKV